MKYDISKLLSGGVEATAFNEVTRRIIKEESEKLVNEHWLKQARNWSALGHQVVGAEVLGVTSIKRKTPD